MQNVPGHDFGSVSDAVFPCLAAEFGKSFVIGEQIGHMLMHPLRGQVLVCDQKAAAGVHHWLGVETLLAVADGQRHVNGRQAQCSQLGYRSGSGTANHQVGTGKGQIDSFQIFGGMVVTLSGRFGADAGKHVRAGRGRDQFAYFADFASPGQVDDLCVGQQVCGGGGDGTVQALRSQRSASDQHQRTVRIDAKLRGRFTAYGGTVVTDSFPKDNSDFSSYLNKAKDQGCDVIFAPVSIAYSTQLVSQAASLNVGIPFLGSDTWDDNMVLQAAKGTSVQAFVSTFYAEGGNKTFDDGIKAYINGNADAKTTNGGDDTVSAVTAMGYDVYYVALEALKAAGSTDPAKVMEALPGVTYDGVSGHIAFNETGDAIRDTAYIKTIDSAANAWKFVTQQKAS